MTINGTAQKTMFLLLLAMGAACFTWSKTFSAVDANPAAAMPWAFGGAIVGLIAAIAICFKHTWAPMLAPFYALAEGLFLGGVSANQPLHAGPRKSSSSSPSLEHATVRDAEFERLESGRSNDVICPRPCLETR